MTLLNQIPGDVFSRMDVGMPKNPGGQHRELAIIDTWVTHWTTGDALGTPDTIQWVKNIYDYHTGNRGWADIGYNYLVDRFGNVFVGRGRFRRGAHAPGANLNGMGVAYLGGKAADISNKGKEAMHGLWSWLTSDGGVDIPGDRRFGHRDINQTTCPGDTLYQWTRDGMSMRQDDPEPEPGDPSDTTPDYIVAVIADNDVDEGMARVLGKAYRWKFLHASQLDGVTIGTAVRVGAARSINHPAWSETHDIGGADRDATAQAVMDRIHADEGDSRSVT